MIKERILDKGAYFLLGGHLLLLILAWQWPSITAVTGIPQTLLLLLFSLIHAARTLGYRSTLTFFLLSTTFSWLFEQAGVATGLIYGAYTYSNMLGPRLGHVPILIPISWFTMMYPSFIIANLISYGRFAPRFPTQLPSRLWLSFLAAITMTAWDLTIDPIMTELGMWTWHEEGAYFGVPIHNFLGWLATTFTIYLVFLAKQKRVEKRPSALLTPAFMTLPVLTYLAQILPILNRPALALIASFVMGPLALIALAQTWQISGAPATDQTPMPPEP